MTRETIFVLAIVVATLGSLRPLVQRLEQQREITKYHAFIEANRAAMQREIDSCSPTICRHDPADAAAARIRFESETAAVRSATR